MMKLKSGIIIITLMGSFLVIHGLGAQSAHKLLRSGDKSYEENDYVTAEESYR